MAKRGIPKHLSKSKLMLGLQCPKALYLDIHRLDLVSPTSPGQQFILDQGNEVGRLARKEWPNGHFVESKHYDIEQAALTTSSLVQDGAEVIF